ncbi:MAG TPA: Lrp/AsnC family transcriptional regulator [Candidatus Nanoarchaeia archaeon]|nr:Lrp/AsnC family transcriptional regulator [Candidatus Nanoarchaeia archaeon]
MVVGKFTENEKKVVKSLIENARTSDAHIGRKLNISLQAVRKIRKKLEHEGIITGYSTQIDYEKIGMSVFAVALLEVQAEAWEKFGGRAVNSVLMHPNAIKFYRIPQADITHLIIYGFRNLAEYNDFFEAIQEQQARYIRVKGLYTISNKNFARKSASDLIRKLLDEAGKEKPSKPNPFS